MSANRLDQEVSPYLLQHKDNPVHWLAWGAEAFEQARALDRPILLSVGYAACHWCHVMAHESFEKPDTAAAMNRLFINIKVDREERPDIDQIYQAALSALGQSGGWPLTMFLTPDGEPFWGGTYFPPKAMYGRPGFVDVLEGVASTYRDHRGKVEQNVGVLREALTRLTDNADGDQIGMGVLDRIAERLLREVDPFLGGIGGAPKFPQTPIFELLWRAYLRTGREPYRVAVVNTLTHMCQGGIYDHLGGGFARYSTDERWLAPHFEKMLYDNGQLLRLLTLVWQKTREPLFEQRIRETVGWLLREMIAEGGGFAASLDADSEGEEGRFYVWKAAEIDAILGPDAAMFKAVYDVSSGGNWEGVNILNRPDQPNLKDDATEQKLAKLRERLLAARGRRVRPGWDDKVLADWNGLTIAGLSEAALALNEPEWLTAAMRAYAFIRSDMMIDGRLRHTARAGVVKHTASVDDLAMMVQAALALFDASGDPSCLADAAGWTAILNEHHWDNDSGGYCFTADDAAALEGAPLICRVKSAHDSSTPAGNGVMLGALTRLYALTGDEAYRDRATALLAAFAGEVSRNFFPLPTLLNSVETHHRLTQIVLIGAAEELAQEVFRHSLPDRSVLRVADPAQLPESHPAFGKTALDGKPTAYVCRGQSCSAPVTDTAGLAALLQA
jgi:uncharacterized protein